MSDAPIHYYDVIQGGCVCGAQVRSGHKTYSVFPDQVSCPACLALIKGATKATEPR